MVASNSQFLSLFLCVRVLCVRAVLRRSNKRSARRPKPRTCARRLQRPAGAQRLSADHPPAGRPLDRLHRPSRRHRRRAQAGQSADRQGRRQRHLDRRRHRSREPEISRAHSRARRANEAGGAQMVRVCDGKDAAQGRSQRSTCCAPSATRRTRSGTSPIPRSRLLITRIGGLKDTHKNWWECDTGIAYLVSGAPDWRTRRMTQVYDLSDPANPVKIRNFGLPGQQPGATGAVPTEAARADLDWARRATASISATAPTRAACCRSSIATSC